MHGYPVMQVVQYHLPPHALHPPLPHSTIGNSGHGESKKYVFCCTVCGGLVTVLGSLFLTVYFLLRSLTSSLNYFETVPTFVPASMLIFTGILIMILSKRKYRNNYLIKVSGLCCLICALICVLVTITTTVIHMNRLQTLRECVYTKKTRTCTCYSVLLEAQSATDEGMRFVFESTPDCEVIHGELYVCLRMMFGISVTGILVCIFSCMLMYQLLSHEKKKMYWEQLELRCRSFYQQHTNPSSGSSHGGGSVREPPQTIASTIYCSCCDECRYPPLPLVGPAQLFPSWETHNAADRFWTPGRIGNFYSPNPGDLQSLDDPNRSRNGGRSCGWSWRRFPWSRNSAQNDLNHRDSSAFMYQGVASSADSQYGFTTATPASGGVGNAMIIGNDPSLPRDPISGSSDSYSMLDNRQLSQQQPPPMGGVYVWGPPPPYSNPNSPARRVFHSPAHRYPHHLHHHHHNPTHLHESHCQMTALTTDNNQSLLSRNAPSLSSRNRTNRPSKLNYENNTIEPEIHREPNDDLSESTDDASSGGCRLERVSHTLPVRKIKKRGGVDTTAASVKVLTGQSKSKINVQNVFGQDRSFLGHQERESSNDEVMMGRNEMEDEKVDAVNCRFLPRLQGVENPTFQKTETNDVGIKNSNSNEAAESEVYFADVSSCCNVSVKNDSSSLYDEATENDRKNVRMPQQDDDEDEDYLAHRMRNGQMSVRCRMPIPLPNNNDLVGFASDMKMLPKDVSQNSLCGSVQTPLTETTDDSPAITPTGPDRCSSTFYQDDNLPLDPPPKNGYLAPDAQYEAISATPERNAPSNLTNTISGLNFAQSYYKPKKFSYLPGGVASGSLGESCRKNAGSNITNLIQNLGSNSGGLLYGEASAGEEEGHVQSCHSDGTMDSGWQSENDKKIEENRSNHQ